MKEPKKESNFIVQIVDEDLAKGMSPQALRFRFPPEPNGFLHIGHAAAICLNFGLGERFNAPVNLRFDDTNPAKEESKYIAAIKKDVAWLGFSWDKECFASDYFQQLYEWAIVMVKEGKAYIDTQNGEQIAAQKGTPVSPGTNSPYRERSVTENLSLFEKMKNGGIAQGGAVLRAKIDMAHPNMHMRDPIMYRIIDMAHHRTGDKWRIYPMYDWTHGQSDHLEKISHSFCTLEFKPHRDLYEWYLTQVNPNGLPTPKQREFARRNLSYTITSKRKLATLIEEKVVTGWDDPRMPTISGLRRRGYTPASIKKFSQVAGIAKRDNVTDVALLEHCIKEDLNQKAQRVMVVLDPVEVIITNYPKDQEEWLTGEYNPEAAVKTSRKIPFSKTLYIEKEDFREEANKKFFRLKLGGEVRLKNAYIIKANEVIKDEEGNITKICCTYDPLSKSGSGTAESLRKVKGTLHWVSKVHAKPITVRLYDRLFSNEAPDADSSIDFKTYLNKKSLVSQTAWAEPALVDIAALEVPFQFQRKGYFCLDPDKGDCPIFNRTVGLTDNWQKKQNQPKGQNAQRNPAFERVGGLAGKYLKTKTDEERTNIADEIKGLKDAIPREMIGFEMGKAQSNKEVLRLLLLLPHETNKDMVFLKNVLRMKNSTVLVVALSCIKNQQLTTALSDELAALKSSCSNDFVLAQIPSL